MTANSASNHPTINQWLVSAAQQLRDAGVPSARLDAELLACHVLKMNKVQIISSNEDVPPMETLAQLDEDLAQRLDRLPIAYITGRRDFYGRTFAVTRDTLIPRPETETIVEACLELIDAKDIKTVLDIGCGTGCIGISIALERPKTSVTLSDISKSALATARLNAAHLQANVAFIQSSLLDNITGAYDMIVANLPYVPRNMQLAPELSYEPSIALFAENDGLSLIYQLVSESTAKQSSGQFLVLESHTDQIDRIADYCTKNGYREVSRQPFCSVFQKS